MCVDSRRSKQEARSWDQPFQPYPDSVDLVGVPLIEHFSSMSGSNEVSDG